MSKSDTIGFIMCLAATTFFGWFIWHAVKVGRWRYRGYRGAIAYRDKTPRLFWGIIIFACIGEVGLVLISLMLINKVIFCGSSVIPKVCIAQTFHRFRQ
jgi:hypothetical protein